MGREIVVLEQKGRNGLESFRRRKLSILSTSRTIKTDNYDKFWITRRTIPSIGGIRSTIFTFFKSSLTTGYLRSTGLPSQLISRYTTGLGKSHLYRLCEHRSDFLRSGFANNATNRNWLCRNSIAIRIHFLLNNIGLHINSTIRQYRICSSHLYEIDLNTLTKRHRKKFCPWPLLIRLKVAGIFAIECESSYISESKM